jgi:hypothetical protein
LIDIDAGDGKSGVRQFDGQRQADVAQADHTGLSFPIFDLLAQLF